MAVQKNLNDLATQIARLGGDSVPGSTAADGHQQTPQRVPSPATPSDINDDANNEAQCYALLGDGCAGSDKSDPCSAAKCGLGRPCCAKAAATAPDAAPALAAVPEVAPASAAVPEASPAAATAPEAAPALGLPVQT